MDCMEDLHTVGRIMSNISYVNGMSGRELDAPGWW